MEVKELNSNNPLLFNKSAAVSSSTEAFGAGFASFLSQTSASILPDGAAGADVKIANNSDANKVSNKAENKANNKAENKADNKTDDLPRKENAASKKEGAAKSEGADRPSKKEASKKNKSVIDDLNEVNLVDNKAEIAPEKGVSLVSVGVAVAEDSVPTAGDFEAAAGEMALVESTLSSAPAPISIPASTSLPEIVVSAEQLPNVSDDIQVTIGEETFHLSDFVVGPKSLAAIGDNTIKLFDSETGQTYITTGNELLKKMQLQSEMYAPVSDLDVLSAQNVPAIDISEMTAVKDGEKISLQVKSETEVLPEDVNISEAPELAKVAVNAKSTLSETSKQEKVADLQPLIDDGEELKVSINTNEEKIAYTTVTDLVKDKNVLQEALAKVAKTDVKSEKINEATIAPVPTSTPVSGNIQAANSAQPNVTNFVPLADANAQAKVAVETIAKASPSVVASEVGSTTLATAGTSGSEFVNNAKVDNLARANDTSFRDVYKGMSKEVVEQVKVNITKSAVKGVDKIDISLRPEELGRIEIKMQIAKDGKLHAHIISNRPETMEVLQKDVQSLEKAFNDAGFQTDEGSLSFSFNQGNQAGSNQEKNAELRNFIGNMFENEKSAELVNTESNYNWSPENGLNIRV